MITPADVPSRSEVSSGHDDRPGWLPPRPERVPRPTYWPAVLSLGVVLLAWGAVTSPIVSLVGAVAVAASLWGWIREIDHEHHT
jgi:hypothetical protein